MALIPELVKSKELRSFNTVLWDWIKVVKQIAATWSWDDCPWWYTERALVSTLAAGVWNSRGIAFEEYSNAKGRGRERYTGRCDLYIKMGSQEFIAEAKRLWSQGSRRAKQIIPKIEEQLSQARTDIKNAQGEGETKLGIVFTVPIIPKSEADEVELLLAEWQNKVKSIQVSSLAWVFPAKTRRLSGDKRDIYIYPGVAILIQRL